jgi:hypothetical protein
MTDSSATETTDRETGSSSQSSEGSLSHLAIPRMGAESGYQLVSEEEVPPLRTSGIVCFIFGLLSFWAIVAWQMLIIPIIAIVFGCIAMRKWGKIRPAGTTVAVIGLVLASGFGATGVMIPMMKQRTLGKQAEYFAREFLELCGDGEVELALELRKPARNRQIASMDLKKAYSEDKVASTEMENAESGMIETVREAGPDIDWQLAQPVRAFYKYGVEKVDTYWIDPSGKVDKKIQVMLEWSPNEEEQTGQWHVSMFQFYREMIVAPSVL